MSPRTGGAVNSIMNVFRDLEPLPSARVTYCDISRIIIPIINYTGLLVLLSYHLCGQLRDYERVIIISGSDKSHRTSKTINDKVTLIKILQKLCL